MVVSYMWKVKTELF